MPAPQRCENAGERRKGYGNNGDCVKLDEAVHVPPRVVVIGFHNSSLTNEANRRERTARQGRLRAFRLSGWLGCSVNRMLPARKDQDSGMTTKRTRQHLSTLDTQTDAPVLDSRQRRLRDATKLGQLILAEALELADDTHRFPRRDI